MLSLIKMSFKMSSTNWPFVWSPGNVLITWKNTELSYIHGFPFELGDSSLLHQIVFPCRLMGRHLSVWWQHETERLKQFSHLARGFTRSLQPFWMTSSSKISCSYKNFEENLTNFVVNAVPASGLLPLSASTSAGTIMTKDGFHIYHITLGWALHLYEM